MGRAPRIDIPDGTHHITMRGNRRERIYLDDRDYVRFFQFVDTTVTRFRWECHSYCAMPNHFHLLITTELPNLSVGMHALNSGYAHWFNERHGLTGHVFEQRFYAGLVLTDGHFLQSARYIDLNPVRGGICRHPSEWPWSSYAAAAGLGVPAPFLKLTRLHGMLASDPANAADAYWKYVADGLSALVEPEQLPVVNSPVLVPGTRTRLD